MLNQMPGKFPIFETRSSLPLKAATAVVVDMVVEVVVHTCSLPALLQHHLYAQVPLRAQLTLLSSAKSTEQ